MKSEPTCQHVNKLVSLSTTPHLQHVQCGKSAMECWYSHYKETDDTHRFYCESHAPQHGFCAGCGAFSWGVAEFDNPTPFEIPGYCSDCSDTLREEQESWEEEEPYWL